MGFFDHFINLLSSFVPLVEKELFGMICLSLLAFFSTLFYCFKR